MDIILCLYHLARYLIILDRAQFYHGLGGQASNISAQGLASTSHSTVTVSDWQRHYWEMQQTSRTHHPEFRSHYQEIVAKLRQISSSLGERRGRNGPLKTAHVGGDSFDVIATLLITTEGSCLGTKVIGFLPLGISSSSAHIVGNWWATIFSVFVDRFEIWGNKTNYWPRLTNRRRQMKTIRK